MFERRRALAIAVSRLERDHASMSSPPLYDRIGRRYSAGRRTDPAIAQTLRTSIGDARTVLNVGAGTGSYEPSDLSVTAVEPSAAMIAQRPEGSAPVVQAATEALPFQDDAFDVVTAVISDHHWSNRAKALRELRRVARLRVVLVNSDPAASNHFWLTRDYLPGFVDLVPEPYRTSGYWRAELVEMLGEASVEVLPVHHDCHDGFYQAFWRRPTAYLDPACCPREHLRLPSPPCHRGDRGHYTSSTRSGERQLASAIRRALQAGSRRRCVAHSRCRRCNARRVTVVRGVARRGPQRDALSFL